MINAIFILLVIYQIKHFLCDFPLQTPYMLRKFLPTWKEYAKPLAVHAGVHASFTFCIVAMYLLISGSNEYLILWLLPLLDFVIHFVQDRIKASPKLLGRYKALSADEFKKLIKPKLSEVGDRLRNKRLRENTYFWWALGEDQMLHHLTHYLIIYITVHQ